MEIRVLDEFITLPGQGVALLCLDEENAHLLRPGQALTDAQGKRHELKKITVQEDVCLLHIPAGDPAYFERLFRNIFVDATRVVAEDA